MRLNLTMFQKGLILVLIMLLFELSFVGIVANSLEQAEAQIKEDSRVRSVVVHLTRILGLRQSLATSVIRFADSPENSLGNDAKLILDQIPREFQQIRELVANHPDEQKEIGTLAETFKMGIPVIEEARSSFVEQRSGSQASIKSSKLEHFNSLLKLQQLADTATSQAEAALDHFKKLEESAMDEQARSQSILNWCLWGGVILNLVLVLLLVRLFNRWITTRLDALIDNTMRLARGERLNSPLSGDDEIGRVDNAFHVMVETMEKSKRSERASIENAHSVICSINSEAKFTAVNPASLSLWGCSEDDLLGRRFPDLVVSEERASVRLKMQDIMRTGSLTPFECRVLRQDGSQVDMLWSAYWSKPEESFFCIGHDITERKRLESLLVVSEERTRAMLEHLPIAVITIDSSGRSDSVNPKTEQLFGYTAKELIDKGLNELFFVGQHKDEHEQIADDSVWQKTFGKVIELNARHRNGHDFPVELSLTKLETTNGEHTLVQVQDISQRRESERLKREFITMVGQGLSTPLSAMEASLGSIASGTLGSLNEKAQKNVSVAKRNLSYVVSLITGLFSMEQLSSGQLEIKLSTVEIGSLIDRSLEAVRPLAEQRNIRLCTDSTSTPILADANLLVQVLVNLLSNALKFSPQGSTVSILAEERGEQLLIKVIDQGRGIPAEKLKTIFERFEQVEASDATQKGGTGLGLAICKTIIEQHGGSIGVKSEPGHGSTFWIDMPKQSTAIIET
jgi:PAS domain S-box-containing protein